MAGASVLLGRSFGLNERRQEREQDLYVIAGIRGTRDILPSEVGRWQHVERVAADLCARYGYCEVRTPVIEREELFA